MGKITAVPWAELHAKYEELVVAGAHEECRRGLILGQGSSKVPREWATAFARIGYRVQAPSYALKVLHPYIYPENSFAEPAKDEEKIVYASVLYSFGAVDEALGLLTSLSSNEDPEGLFHTGGAHFCLWNYSAGIPFFKSYVNSPGVSEYKKLVGKVNLAAAYIFLEDWILARSLLAEIQQQCLKNSYQLLLGNSYELLAQIEFFNHRYADAERLLNQALPLLKTQGGFYHLYVEKWLTFCRSFQGLSDAGEIDKLRGQAAVLGHWSTMRECDLFQAVLTKDENLIRKVIMGTPSEAYRQRARKLFGTTIKSKGNFSLRFGPSSGKGEVKIFDPVNNLGSRAPLNKKPMLFGIFNALTEDFYQPSSIGFLFQKIYPDEKFNPFTSPARVLRLLKRLDEWFAENNLPLKINFKKSEFSIFSESPIEVVVHRGTEVSPVKSQIADLKKLFLGRRFSTEDVATGLNISKTSALRLVRKAVDTGALSREAGSRVRPYFFGSARKKSGMAA